MRILWLCSWYPSRIDPFDGDFIQRHAHAAALFNDVYVIHVAADEKGKVTNGQEKENKNTDRLTECIIYFKKTISFFGKVNGFFRWRRLFKDAIAEYIRAYGEPDLVHVHIPLRAGLIALWLKRKYHIPYVVSEHWTIYQPRSSNGFAKRNFVFKFLTRKIIMQSVYLVSVSTDLGKRMNQQVVKKEFVVVPNVANEKLFHYEPVQERPFVFIHVSNMSHQKNVQPIIKCFETLHSEFPDTQLLLVGPLQNSVSQAADATGLLNQFIFLRGEISYEEVAHALREAHALILFSYYENQPCVIIEALCRGRPVITTPVGGIPEIIDEHNGIFVDVDDDTSLLKAMKEMLLGYSAYDLKKISEEARSKFSYTVVGRLFDSIYRRTVKS